MNSSITYEDINVKQNEEISESKNQRKFNPKNDREIGDFISETMQVESLKKQRKKLGD